jgi:hypothetical protein
MECEKMSRKSLETLLSAIIVSGYPIGDKQFFDELNTRLGSAYSGRQVTSFSAKQIVLEAYDRGLLAEGICLDE